MYKNISMMEGYYKAHRSEKLFWAEDLSAWVVMNQEYVGQILRSRSFNVVEHKKNVETYASELGLDLSELASILDFVPLAHNGQLQSYQRHLQAKHQEIT